MYDLTRKETDQMLNMYCNTPVQDRKKVKFFIHSVFDSEASQGEAMRKADAEADKKMRITRKEVIPDYTPENLIRLGAKQVMKDVIYIHITPIRSGRIDTTSREATDQDKEQFSDEWEKFTKTQEYKDYERTIRKRRQTVQTSPVRQPDGEACVYSGFGEFSFETKISQEGY